MQSIELPRYLIKSLCHLVSKRQLFKSMVVYVAELVRLENTLTATPI